MKNIRKIKSFIITLGLVLAFSVIAPRPAAAQTEPYIGQLMLFGGNFCPRGWANADGQLLSINSNQALFSLYGTIYGGDGRTTFSLPDLRGRVPIHAGTGPGLSSYRIGAKGGTESLTVTTNNMPSHSHRVNATSSEGDSPDSATDVLVKQSAPAEGNVQVDPGTIANTGGSQPIQKRSPFLTMTWCVCVEGKFPGRN